MPTQTFFNLPEEKRQRILEGAIEEFAQNPFENASIARIIEYAGIPRGSFYQYFEDIKDLYKYLLEMIGEKKFQYFQQILPKVQLLSTFKMIREIYGIGIEFAKENPKLAAIGNHFFKLDNNLKQEIMGEMEGKSNDFFENLLKMGQAKGEISQRIDIKVAAFMFTTLHLGIVDLYLEENQGKPIFENTESYLALVDKMLYVVENGLRAREL